LKGDYYISIQSGKIAIICGFESVCLYNSDRIVLRLSGGKLTFTGDGLTLSSYFGNEIKIAGNIKEFHFGESVC
jgi:hypothetical protein